MLAIRLDLPTWPVVGGESPVAVYTPSPGVWVLPLGALWQSFGSQAIFFSFRIHDNSDKRWHLKLPLLYFVLELFPQSLSQRALNLGAYTETWHHPKVT